MFLQAMQQCGFVLSTVDVEKGQLTARNFRSTIGCYQELSLYLHICSAVLMR
jgi:sporulation-control protein